MWRWLSAEPPQTHAARVLARIETPLFAAPSFPPVESVYALAALPTCDSAASRRRPCARFLMTKRLILQ